MLPFDTIDLRRFWGQVNRSGQALGVISIDIHFDI